MAGNSLQTVSGHDPQIPDFQRFLPVLALFLILDLASASYFRADFRGVSDLGSSNGLAHSIRTIILPKVESPRNRFQVRSTSQKCNIPQGSLFRYSASKWFPPPFEIVITNFLPTLFWILLFFHLHFPNIS